MTAHDLDMLLDPAPDVRRPALPAVLERPVASVFGALARLRHRRPLHPRGRVLHAVLRVPDDPRLPAAWRALDGAPAVVRRSRGAGLPAGWPDVLGVAVRSGPQDLLLSSSMPGLPVLPWPARDGLRCVYSSVTRYRLGSVHGLLIGRFAAGGRELRLHVRGAGLPVGVVLIGDTVADPGADRVRFDPWRAGAGLSPSGIVHRLRGPAYAASRERTYR